MTQATGAEAQLIFDHETTWGTTPGTPSGIIMPFVTAELGETINQVQSNTLQSGRNPKKPANGQKQAGGNIVVEMNHNTHGYLLYHLFGAVSVTGTSPYTHTFSVGTLPAGFLAEIGFTDLATPEYYLNNGLKMASASFQVTSEGFLQVTFNVEGKSESEGTTSVDGSASTSTHTPFTMNEVVLQESGSNIVSATDLSFELNNNLDGSVYTIGNSGRRGSLPSGTVAVSGNLTCLLDDAHGVGLITKARNSTESSIKATFSRGDGLGSSGNEKLELLIPELIFGKERVGVQGPTGQVVNLPFTAYYEDSTEATTMQAKLFNAVADYTA